MAINFPTSKTIHRWRPTAWLKVAGDDAEIFLQGQFSNDLRGLAVGAGAVYGLWLDVKGRVLADSFVLRGDAGKSAGANPGFWVGSYFSAATVIRDRLESHVIADDVTIEDQTASWAAVSLLGPEAGRLGAEQYLPRDGAFSSLVFSGRRTREENTEWVFPIAAGETVRQLFAGLPELDATAMERQRIAAGIPAVPADVGPGDLPNEGGLDRDAISYTKGCYLGQEVMARLKSMGRVRRRLLRVTGIASEFPARPAALFLGERKVGELRSAVKAESGGFTGLAMLSLMHLEPAVSLAFGANGEPAVQLEDGP